MPQTVAVPDNVPPELVVDFDFYTLAGKAEDIQLAWAELHKGPDIVWTPHYGGYWIATRAADIQVMQVDHEHFSHNEFDIPLNPGRMKSIPLSLDPPDHTPYRKLLMTGFTPQKVRQYSEVARETAQELVATLKPRGECEFIDDFAKVLPINVFLTMMGLPLSDRDFLLPRAEIAVRSNDIELKARTQGELAGYLMGHIEDRKANPREDLLGMIVNGEVSERALTPHEIMAMSLLVLVGGLDTVASQIGFVAHFLAKNPGHRRELVENPKLAQVACEEFLRRYGLPNTARQLTEDYDYKGLKFKKGDMIQMPKCLYGLDDRINANPEVVDFHRKPSEIKHAAFGAGPHVCPGNVLARRELIIFLEEWLPAIPDFEIDPDRPPVFAAGSVNGVDKLYLKWAV
ncbi:cytochrome P450 [Sphingopyxis sp. OPL5]|uniref:cytochrome P450 n=1 Tax=Sphingopyxis sp. OPL5 TaxID=2486273 RepID=UPI00164CE18D|nr:cytochrome P450 [Sphingopyxis sp. OPL5]QNO28802.1 cytochrome P450 [Sphingopyxis sp. OPL5]